MPTFATRANLDLLEDYYRRWRADPASVDERWQAFFERFELGGCALGRQDHGRKRWRGSACRRLRGVGFIVRIRIDELGLDRATVAAEEHELVTFREAPLHDRGRERRDHIFLDRTLDRRSASRLDRGA